METLEKQLLELGLSKGEIKVYFSGKNQHGLVEHGHSPIGQ